VGGGAVRAGRSLPGSSGTSNGGDRDRSRQRPPPQSGSFSVARNPSCGVRHRPRPGPRGGRDPSSRAAWPRRSRGQHRTCPRGQEAVGLGAVRVDVRVVAGRSPAPHGRSAATGRRGRGRPGGRRGGCGASPSGRRSPTAMPPAASSTGREAPAPPDSRRLMVGLTPSTGQQPPATPSASAMLGCWPCRRDHLLKGLLVTASEVPEFGYRQVVIEGVGGVAMATATSLVLRVMGPCSVRRRLAIVAASYGQPAEGAKAGAGGLGGGPGGAGGPACTGPAAGVYDPDGDRSQTICKYGTGFADAELAASPPGWSSSPGPGGRPE
jgi:hypothetical protein